MNASSHRFAETCLPTCCQHKRAVLAQACPCKIKSVILGVYRSRSSLALLSILMLCCHARLLTPATSISTGRVLQVMSAHHQTELLLRAGGPRGAAHLEARQKVIILQHFLTLGQLLLCAIEIEIHEEADQELCDGVREFVLLLLQQLYQPQPNLPRRSAYRCSPKSEQKLQQIPSVEESCAPCSKETAEARRQLVTQVQNWSTAREGTARSAHLHNILQEIPSPLVHHHSDGQVAQQVRGSGLYSVQVPARGARFRHGSAGQINP